MFEKKQDRIYDSWKADDKAVILKVSSLDETGQPTNVQWRHDHEKEAEANDVEAAQGHAKHGYGVVVAALFIIGEMIGGGIISMPNAVCRSGWAGIALIILCCVASAYTGIQLSRCWMILQHRWPEVYQQHTQNPYPQIGYRVGGRWCGHAVSLCVNLTMVGTATVFLLMTGRNVTQLMDSWAHSNASFCYYVLMALALLLPVTYFGSPKDFWQVSLGAAGTTTVAVIIMLIGMSKDYAVKDDVQYSTPTVVSFVLGYGTIAFASSGQACFPTVQHDMKQPEKFPKAVVLSFAIMFVYYLPLSALGYLVYGDKLSGESVLPHLPSGWIQDTVTTLITLHVMFGFIIYMNPFNQELERWFKIPPTFTWKRLVLRTATALLVGFIAESIPAMNLILDLLGGTCMAVLTFVCPPSFYLALRWKTTTVVSSIDKPIRKWEYVLAVIIMFVGALGACASVYAFVSTVVTGGHLFKLPCYVNGGN